MVFLRLKLLGTNGRGRSVLISHSKFSPSIELVSVDLPTKNEKAYAELVMLLDKKSFSMILTDAFDDGRKALEILRDLYKDTGNPRILTIYNNLSNMKYISDQGLTEYISRAERLASSLKKCQ